MAGGGPAQYPEVYAARQSLNEDATIYFGIAIIALMLILIIFHITRLAAQKTSVAPSKPPAFAAPFLYTSRSLRRALIRKVPGLPSAGHAGIAIIYVGVNLILTFTHLLDHPVMTFKSNIASRTGWLALVNICLAIFLGMKNTPLGYLTTWSYERLNVLHQIVGYTAMALTIIHASLYTDYFAASNNLARLRVIDEIYGIVSGFTMLTLVVVGFTIRRRYYELFYLIHVSFFVLTMVFIGLHQPDLYKKIFVMTTVGGSIWVFDRLVRIARVTLYSFNNKATVYPLPHGGTRIVLRKAPKGAKSGEHCFLWIPKIRSIEMHPFTIAAMDPLEFVVASYDGFTRDLHHFARANPGATIRASVEGSYGTFPDPTAYDKVVLIAGGSGASFTVGMALNMLKRLEASSQQSIVLVWMVKDYDHLEWFSGHLSTLRHTVNANISLFVTRSAQPPMTMTTTLGQINTCATAKACTPDSAPSSPADTEKKYPLDRPSAVLTRHISDPEKSGTESDMPTPLSPTAASHLPPILALPRSHLHGIPITYARPDVPAIIKDAIDQTPVNHRILVMGCGPDGLMAQVRNTTAQNIKPTGPAVELHCEQFGW